MKIIQIKNQNCFDNLVATIAANEHKDYELMLSKSWGFDFNDSKESVGEKIHYSSKNDFYMLRKFHGIEVLYIEDKFNLDVHNQYCEYYEYIGAAIDTFKCPWDKSYKKYHNYGHSILVNDVDFRKGKVYVVDPFYKKINEEIDLDMFCDSVCGIYLFKMHDDNKEVDDHLLYSKIIDRLKKTSSDIDKIILFRDYILKMNKQKEQGEMNNVWYYPIIVNINKISLSRLRYIIMLKYFSRLYKIHIGLYIKELEHAHFLWNFVRDMLVRFFVLNNDKYLGNVVCTLDTIKKEEKTTCLSLIDALLSHNSN